MIIIQKLLRNYQVHNPIINDNLPNITAGTNNVLYQSLNTDSSESEEGEHIQSLNIVIHD